MTGLTKSLSGGVPNSNSAEALIPVVAIIGERGEVYHNALTERNGRGELVPNLHKLKRAHCNGRGKCATLSGNGALSMGVRQVPFGNPCKLNRSSP